MTPAQFRVLVMLFLAAAIDVNYNEQEKADFLAFLKAVFTANTNTNFGYIRREAAWIVAAVAVVTLTAASEAVGQWTAALVLAYAALRHGSQVAGTINSFVGLATAPASTSTPESPARGGGGTGRTVM